MRNPTPRCHVCGTVTFVRDEEGRCPKCRDAGHEAPPLVVMEAR